MVEPDPISGLHGSIIHDVMLVDELDRQHAGPFNSESLPGHLIHIVTRGEVEQRSGGITQHFGAGDAIWYYENEPIQGRILDTPWTFYTVNFRAPRLSAPPLDQRVKQAAPETIERMAQLLTVWRQTDTPAALRHLRIHALLLEIIADLLPADAHSYRVDRPTELWWEIEAKLREDLAKPIDLRFLQQLSHRSQRSIIRACHLATGLPPMKRVKQIRLSYARGLVQLSDFPMSEIAFQIGYNRVQEFSRDYRKRFGTTPSEDRSIGPTYRRDNQRVDV